MAGLGAHGDWRALCWFGQPVWGPVRRIWSVGRCHNRSYFRQSDGLLRVSRSAQYAVAVAHTSRKLADLHLCRAGIALRFVVGIDYGYERSVKRDSAYIVVFSCIGLCVA